MKVTLEWFDRRRFYDTVVEVEVAEPDGGLDAEMRQISNVVDRYGSRLLQGILPSAERPVRFDGDQLYPLDPWRIVATWRDRQLGYRLVSATCNGMGEPTEIFTLRPLPFTTMAPEIFGAVWELDLEPCSKVGNT